MIWAGHNSEYGVNRIVLFNGMVFTQRQFSDYVVDCILSDTDHLESFMSNDQKCSPYTKINRNVLQTILPILKFLNQRDALLLLVDAVTESQYAAIVDFLSAIKPDFSGADIVRVIQEWRIR